MGRCIFFTKTWMENTFSYHHSNLLSASKVIDRMFKEMLGREIEYKVCFDKDAIRVITNDLSIKELCFLHKETGWKWTEEYYIGYCLEWRENYENSE